MSVEESPKVNVETRPLGTQTSRHQEENQEVSSKQRQNVSRRRE